MSVCMLVCLWAQSYDTYAQWVFLKKANILFHKCFVYPTNTYLYVPLLRSGPANFLIDIIFVFVNMVRKIVCLSNKP